jgi:hypothetical protein
MPVGPGLGRGFQKAVFDGQGLRRGDKRIDAGGMGGEHGAGFSARDLVIGLGRLFQPEGAHQAVFGQPLGPDAFGPPAQGPMPVVIHVPEPILSGNKPLRKKDIVLVLGPNMRDSPVVSNDLDGLAQSLQPEG